MVRPFRGDVVAAGAVALAALAVVAREPWVAAAAALLLLALATSAPGQRRAYHAALELSALTALGAALLLGELDRAVAAAGVAAAGGWFAVRRGSPPALLVGVVALGVAIVETLGDTRWLVVLALACALGAVARRDRRPQQAEALAEAGGLAVAAILLGHGGAGWQVLGAAAGFGLVALGGVERRRGQVLVGLIVLALWARVAGPAWLVVLGVAALAFLAVGLRPARPLPPEPPRGGPGVVKRLGDPR